MPFLSQLLDAAISRHDPVALAELGKQLDSLNKLADMLRLDSSSAYYACASRAAAQAIDHASWTVIAFDTETDDTADMHTSDTPTIITITHAGLYLVTLGVSFAASAGGSARQIELRLNGVSAAGATSPPGTPKLSASYIAMLAADDYLDARIYQDSGGALNIVAPTRLAAVALSR